MATDELTVDTNAGYVAQAVAGQSSIAETEEVARKAAAQTHEIAKLESTADEGMKSGAAAADSEFGLLADIAMDALGIGAVGKVMSAGLTIADERAVDHHGSTGRGTTPHAPKQDAFQQGECDTKRAPGAYRDSSPHNALYGGNPKGASFAAPTSAKTSGLFERASIACMSLAKQDSAGLVDTSPKNLATMDSDDAAEKITARVSTMKQQVSVLKNSHELAQQSVRPAMDANYAARARAMQMAPGLAMNGPSYRPDDMINAAKNVSEWNDPDRWRGVEQV